MAGQFSIKEVIKRSTSQVSLDDLNRKGVKRVKVLNQDMITRLIGQAVDRVISKRAEEISSAERERVIKESRERFESLAKEQVAQERSRAQELESANRSLAEQLSSLQKQVEGSDELKRGIQETVVKIETLEAENVDLKAQLAGRNAELEAQNQALSKKTEELAAKASDLSAKVAEFNSKSQQLSAREASLKEKLEELGARQTDLDRREAELNQACDELSSVSAESDEESNRKDEEIQRLRLELLDRERCLARVEGQLTAKNDEIQRLSSGEDGPDVDALKESLQGLQKSISDIAARGGFAGGRLPSAADPDVDPETMLKFVDRGDESMESNVSKVKVHKKKSGGVNSSLAKLKELQKGV